MSLAQTLNPPLTPIQSVCDTLLRLSRWKIIGSFPVLPKYIVIGAPHTSNWDFWYMLLIKGRTGVNFHWLGKDSLFRGPLGSILKRLGGIPVYREKRNNLVDQIIEKFKSQSDLKIAITPEGTRSKSKYWKTGFYYMALGAGVPIQLVSIDYPPRTLEIGPLLTPGGDIQKDFDLIQDFYKRKKGRHPQKQGEICVSE